MRSVNKGLFLRFDFERIQILFRLCVNAEALARLLYSLIMHEARKRRALEQRQSFIVKLYKTLGEQPCRRHIHIIIAVAHRLQRIEHEVYALVRKAIEQIYYVRADLVLPFAIQQVRKIMQKHIRIHP